MRMPETLTTPTRPRRRLRRWLLITIGIILAVLLGFTGYSLWHSHDGDIRLQNALAETDRQDPGWRLEDLEAKRTVYPDSRNSGPLLIEAVQRLPRSWPRWRFPQAPENKGQSMEQLVDLGVALDQGDPPRELSADETTALREELARVADVLPLARKIVDFPGGRYPITYAPDGLSTSVQHTVETLRVVGLLKYDALLRAQGGDMDGALASCRALLCCGRAIGDEPSLISFEKRTGVRFEGVREIERVLSMGEPSAGALNQLQEVVDEEAKAPVLLIGARGERAMVDRFMNALQNGEATQTTMWASIMRVPGVIKNIHAELLSYDNMFVAAVKQPVEKRRQALKEFELARVKLTSLARPLSVSPRVLEGAFHDQIYVECARAAVAAERFRRARGRWPTALNELAPEMLPSLPLDPYDGQPLRMRHMGDTLAVYSVWPDGQDYGGNCTMDPTREDANLGFRLWDVQHRRQPPRSAAPR
jgi:hypothetical protein